MFECLEYNIFPGKGGVQIIGWLDSLQYVQASVEAILIVAYKLAHERWNSWSESPSNIHIHNSNNNDGLAFYKLSWAMIWVRLSGQ